MKYAGKKAKFMPTNVESAATDKTEIEPMPPKKGKPPMKAKGKGGGLAAFMASKKFAKSAK